MSLAFTFKNQLDRFKDNGNPVIATSETLSKNREAIVKNCTGISDDEYLVATFYDIISCIRDPEHNNTLEELNIVSPQSIELSSSLLCEPRTG
jgi:hypothetical protein